MFKNNLKALIQQHLITRRIEVTSVLQLS